MSINKGDKIKLDNNKEYILVDKIILKDKYYFYLVNLLEPTDLMFCEYDSLNQELEMIINEELLKELTLKILKDNINI